MARRFTIQLLMDLATQIGANPAKAMSRSNISFLGKGPVKNPLFQRPLPGLENATTANLGKPETLFTAIEDAVGWAKDGKLNSIQTEILGHNLLGIKNIVKPPPLQSAKIMTLPQRGEGIKSLEGVDPRDTILPMQRSTFTSKPDELRRITAIQDLSKGKPPGFKPTEEQIRQYMIGRRASFKDREWEMPGDRNLWGPKSRLPEPGPGELEAFKAGMVMQTGQSRAIAREILLKDTRLNLPDDVISSLRSKYDLAKGADQKWDPLELMKKYYGRSMNNYDDFLNQVDLTAAGPDEFAEMVLKNIKLTPSLTFAGGGLAKILEVNDQVSRYDLM